MLLQQCGCGADITPDVWAVHTFVCTLSSVLFQLLQSSNPRATNVDIVTVEFQSFNLLSSSTIWIHLYIHRYLDVTVEYNKMIIGNAQENSFTRK